MMTLATQLMFIVSLTFGPFYFVTNQPMSCCDDNSSEDLQETTIEAYAYLEGAYSAKEGNMSNKLNKLGYLPGQNPKAFFAKTTKPGQPYSAKPWNYLGKEGVVKKNEFYNYSKKVVDWVLISLRTREDRNSTIYKAPALIYQDGSIEIASGAKKAKLSPNESYYIVIEHRNHLAVMSERPLQMNDGKLHYDFRNSLSYMEGHKEIGKGIFAMVAGNANQTSSELTMYTIDEDDLKSWEGGNGLNSSYFIQDLDLSGDVSVKDKEILYNNLGLFSTVPQ